MPAATIEHITVNTGHLRRSPRSEVADDIVAMVRQGLATGGHLGPDWKIKTVQKLPAYKPAAWVMTLIWRDLPVARCVVCKSPRFSDAAWAALMTARAADGSAPQMAAPTGAPWVASYLLPAAIKAGPSAMGQCGDLERCLAWAVLES